MSYSKTPLLFLSLFCAQLLITACTTAEKASTKKGYLHSGIYFGKNLSNIYKLGIKDGCKTSKGAYTKSHYLFTRKSEYVDGWFMGRNKCKHLLKINKNGDIISL